MVAGTSPGNPGTSPGNPIPPTTSGRTNPFAVTSGLSGDAGVYGDHARRLRGAFLFRVIRFERPIAATLTYSGWWFRQKIDLDGEVVWFRISWLTIFRRLEFQVPARFWQEDSSAGASRGRGLIEIEFTRGLLIRRFRIWIDDQIVYDEIN